MHTTVHFRSLFSIVPEYREIQNRFTSNNTHTRLRPITGPLNGKSKVQQLPAATKTIEWPYK